VVRAHPSQPGRYLLVAGERRWRAAQAASLTDIPAVIRAYQNDQDAAADSAVENLQRADLTVSEEAALYQTLMTVWDVSARKLGERLNISHQRISRTLRIAANPALATQVDSGELTYTAAFNAAAEPIDPPVLYHNDTTATPVPPAYGPLPPPAPPAPLPKDPAARVFKPYFAFQKAVQTTNPAALSPTERADLREIVRTLRAELQGLEAELGD
jgi:hypothetical protein